MRLLWAIVQRVLLVLLSVLLALSAVELGARLYMRVNTLYMDMWTFRAARPAPYHDAPYFSAAFISESFRQPGKWLYPPGYILPGNYEGVHFHVRNHRRVTTDQPLSYQHTLYILGGSTVYASEVPDEYTIPSQFQRRLNEEQPGMWRVENIGVTSVTSAQEVARLKTIALQPGDLVIFYHGINDAVQSLYYRGADGTMAGTIRQKYDSLSSLERLRFDLYRRFSPSSSAVALLLYPYSTAVPDWLQDPAELARYKAELAQVYRRNMQAARGYTAAAGATMVDLLQPNLFSLAEPSGYELALMNNPYLTPPGMETALHEGYAVLRDLPGVVDISAAFDGYGGLYLDYAHVTETGNRLAAAVVYEAITE
jgi:lysophospholipase L1-like esterase